MQHPQFSPIYKSVTAASLLLRPEIEFQHKRDKVYNGPHVTLHKLWTLVSIS